MPSRRSPRQVNAFHSLREDLKKQVEEGLEGRKVVTELKRSIEAKTLEVSTLSAKIAERDKELERSKRQVAAKEEAVEVHFMTFSFCLQLSSIKSFFLASV